MRWVKLIGGRFLDFTIIGAVVVLICVGLAFWGDKYYHSTREKAIEALKSDGKLDARRYYYGHKETRRAVESELTWLWFLESKGDLNSSQVKKRQEYVKLKRQLNRAAILFPITVVLSIAIGLFGVISVLGIVFRREGLTQREGFVRVWVGVPKYFAGYLRKSNTGGE